MDRVASRIRAGVWVFLGLPFAGGCDCASSVRVGSEEDADAAPGDCSDLDLDEYGVGDGCLGPDCNDSNPEIHLEAQCDPFCDEVGDLATGCPCDSLEPHSCYFGSAGTLGVGRCRAGMMTCEGGLWGTCDGQLLPREELCDEMDDDCDGETDEGVLSECGTCGECNRDCAGPDEECGGWGEGVGSGVVETPEGWLTLDSDAVSQHVIWPSSSGTGEIFRMDTETFEIEGGYWTGPNHGDGAGGAFDGDSPSRSAVDDSGSVVIANRAWLAQGSITKIASDESLCVDLDGDGRIDTSTAWNDRLPFRSHEEWDDECILWHTTLGGVDAIPRAVALHPELGLDGVLEERGWVGLYNGQRFEQFDWVTGELTGTQAPTPEFTPYGAAIDRDGWLWTPGLLTDRVGRFDTSDPEDSFETVALAVGDFPLAMRVLVDENNTPWISGTGIWRWDRDSEAFDKVTVEDHCGDVPDDAFGIMFDWAASFASDGQGSIFVGTYRECIWRVTNDPGAADDLENHAIPTPGVLTFGLAVDFDRHAWTFNYWDGNSAVIDIDTEEVEVVLDDCAGANCLSEPYVRGDVTGLQRRNALQTSSGLWSTVFEGCADDDTDWTRVTVDGLTPAGSNLAVSARTAATLLGLAAQPWTPLGVVPDDGSELDLDAAFDAASIEDARYMEVRVVLQSLDGVTAPSLREVEVQWGCEFIVG